MNTRLAEFIGIMLGDGSFNCYKSNTENQVRHSYRMKITLHASKEYRYAKYISRLIEDLFKKAPKMKKRAGEDTLDVTLFGKKHFDFLISLGLKRSPKWKRATIPKNFRNHTVGKFVLRGYFDTDGCISAVNNNGIRYPRLEMKVSPSPMQNQLIRLLRKYKFSPRVYPLDKGKVRIQIAGKPALKRWYSEIGFSNDKNIQVAQSFFLG